MIRIPVLLLLIFGCLWSWLESAEKSGIYPCSVALRRLSISFEIADFADKEWVDKKFTYAFLSQLVPVAEDVGLLGLNTEQLMAISSLEYKNSRGSRVDFETRVFTRNTDGKHQIVPVISM